MQQYILHNRSLGILRRVSDILIEVQKRLKNGCDVTGPRTRLVQIGLEASKGCGL